MFWPFKTKQTKTFPYKQEVNSWGRTFYRPIALIYIRHQDKSWRPYPFYVDSGADITFVNKSFGNLLGLKLKPNEEKFKMRGIGGEIDAVYRDIYVRIVKKVIKIKVSWILSDDVPLLIGRESVFNKYSICFEENKKKITFKEN